MADKDLDDELVDEENEDEEIDEPGDDDLSDDGDDDDTFLPDDDGEEEPEEAEPPPRRPRRRAPVRPGTIGGVARSRLDKPEHAQKAWDELTAHIDPEDEPVPYSIRENFEKGSRVNHSKFGIGHVVEIVGPQKIEVLFSDCLRKLVQNR